MTSIGVQGTVVVATMRDVAGRVYEANAPVLDGRRGLPSPLGRLAFYIYRLAILIRSDYFLSASRCSQRSPHGTSKFVTSNLYARATKVFNQLIARGNIPKLLDNLLHFAEISPDEHAFMLSTAASLTIYDTHLYICRPYSGNSADFERFISNLEIQLSREHLPKARAATEWKLTATMNGEEDYGELSQADPVRLVARTMTKTPTPLTGGSASLCWQITPSATRSSTPTSSRLSRTPT